MVQYIVTIVTMDTGLDSGVCGQIQNITRKLNEERKGGEGRV
jgi:hypothetical protein